MIFNRSVLMALSLLVLSMPVMADVDITGSYKCSGNDPSDYKDYNSVLIVKNTGQTYDFKWEIVDTGERFYGTGLFSSTIPEQISVEFWNTRNLNNSGVIIYNVISNGNLEGTYTYAEKDYIGRENCTKL